MKREGSDFQNKLAWYLKEEADDLCKEEFELSLLTNVKLSRTLHQLMHMNPSAP